MVFTTTTTHPLQLINIWKVLSPTEYLGHCLMQTLEGWVCGHNTAVSPLGAGIDSFAVVGEGKPRFQFLTHGNETSLNGLSYCTNVIMVGVLHLKPDTIDGLIIGQRDNLTHEQNLEERKRVDTSEKVHKVYQALSRGSCRSVNNGRSESPRLN